MSKLILNLPDSPFSIVNKKYIKEVCFDMNMNMQEFALDCMKKVIEEEYGKEINDKYFKIESKLDFKNHCRELLIYLFTTLKNTDKLKTMMREKKNLKAFLTGNPVNLVFNISKDLSEHFKGMTLSLNVIPDKSPMVFKLKDIKVTLKISGSIENIAYDYKHWAHRTISFNSLHDENSVDHAFHDIDLCKENNEVIFLLEAATLKPYFGFLTQLNVRPYYLKN